MTNKHSLPIISGSAFSWNQNTETESDPIQGTIDAIDLGSALREADASRDWRIGRPLRVRGNESTIRFEYDGKIGDNWFYRSCERGYPRTRFTLRVTF